MEVVVTWEPVEYVNVTIYCTYKLLSKKRQIKLLPTILLIIGVSSQINSNLSTLGNCQSANASRLIPLTARVHLSSVTRLNAHARINCL